jgi:hypothetical protein
VEQQAPGGCEQSVVVQAASSPSYVPPTRVQRSCVRAWQVPFAKQQAPVGCTHGLGLQAVALPW